MGFLESPYIKGRIKKIVSANIMLVTSKGIDIYVNNANAYNYRPN